MNWFNSEPKMFAGISDGTTLLNAITERSKLITFHGPDLLFTFGRPISKFMQRHLKEVLFERSFNITPHPHWAQSREGEGLNILNGRLCEVVWPRANW